MSDASEVHQKRRRGRPATGRDPLVSLRLPKDALARVEAIAAGEGVSRSEVLRRAVVEWLAGRDDGDSLDS
ncbi:ribbon-helix-helix domain-containing protein [Salinarimonas sp. NSM]|uniref:ribbon-helix-helix domain-containing protein n=1 Tax=Salinarimonas sp. NSM TaxID=3458003 RepID=UPI004036B811